MEASRISTKAAPAKADAAFAVFCKKFYSALDLGLEGLAQGDGAADVGLDHFAALPHRGGGDGTGGGDIQYPDESGGDSGNDDIYYY